MLILAFVAVFASSANAQGILNKVKDKVKQRKDQKTEAAIDKGLDKGEEAAKKEDNNAGINTPSKQEPGQGGLAVKKDSVPSASQDFKSYQNYDFVPGDKVLFEDDWREDETGEFPAHWKLTNGEFLVNKYNGSNVLVAKERSDNNGGSEGWEISPRMKTENYLPKEFTIELEYTPQAQKPHDGYDNMCSHGLALRLYGIGNGTETHGDVYLEFFRDGRISTYGFANEFNSTPLESGKPHLLAVAYKNNQLKIYSDGQRLFTVPDVGFEPVRLALGFSTENSQNNLSMIVNHIRLAEGGSMNLLKKLTTATKFIARGIVFDYNKATIKPESMGELNRIVAFMNEDKNAKFEIGGHTDSDGDDAYNLKLSQQRAEAVKAKLVSMGIYAARFTTKGFGETIPISDNKTPEGKANNRRVEFIKK